MTGVRRRWIVVSLLCAVAIGWCARVVLVPEARRALPWSASDVEESRQHNGFLPDYAYWLKAKLPKDEFDKYASRLGLPSYSDEDPEKSSFSIYAYDDRPVWWDPPKDSHGSYGIVQEPEGGAKLLRWKDGNVYYFATEW